MKINKFNPRHWWRLIAFGGAVLLAIMLRPFVAKHGSKRVILYGHRLAGNLVPIHEALRMGSLPGVEPAFLTMDPDYCRQLRERGVHCLRAGSFGSVRWLATAAAVISDHGLHALRPMLRWSDLKFFDVWHGIPFKGFDADDFRVQHRYDEIWTASPMMRDLYVGRFGFREDRVAITGYARTDVLVRRDRNPQKIREKFGLPREGKLLLFAPTWKQDDAGRSAFPFSVDKEKFLGAIAKVATNYGATAMIRLHLNSSSVVAVPRDGIMFVPFSDHPETEELLLVSDVLVCDWSSISFDYLLLQRPTIFLDVPPPFRKGLSLDSSYRYGAVIASLEGLTDAISSCLEQPDSYQERQGKDARRLQAVIYEGFADGNATMRCVQRLADHLGVRVRT